MKLTKEHIGKKMRISDWVATNPSGFFIPLAQSSNQIWVGEDEYKTIESYIDSVNNWEFFDDVKSDPEIKLWSVWEGSADFSFVFVFSIDDIKPDVTDIRFARVFNGGFAYPDYDPKLTFLDKFKLRPDLEVRAPALFREGSVITMSNILYSQETLKLDFYNWPAALALCQIVKKK